MRFCACTHIKNQILPDLKDGQYKEITWKNKKLQEPKVDLES